MERKKLIDEIIRFCFDYRIINKPIDIDEVKENIEQQLKESDFVETLINAIILNTTHHKRTNIKKIKELLLALEDIRLELEYQTPEGDSPEC